MRRKLLTLVCDDYLRDGLRAVRERDGIPEAEQVRRSIKMWLEAKGVLAVPPAPAQTVRRGILLRDENGRPSKRRRK